MTKHTILHTHTHFKHAYTLYKYTIHHKNLQENSSSYISGSLVLFHNNNHLWQINDYFTNARCKNFVQRGHKERWVKHTLHDFQEQAQNFRPVYETEADEIKSSYKNCCLSPFPCSCSCSAQSAGSVWNVLSLCPETLHCSTALPHQQIQHSILSGELANT